MTAAELRQKYLDFFKSKGHTIIPSASLIPENDPTVLFTTAGMHPLVPYLMGENHPGGKRVANVQKCIRTGDIEEVGDATHHTFFEMLGNWSFGDYFKKSAIEFSWEFLTSADWLNLDKNRLAVSVFAGDQDAPFDDEAFDFWKNLGVDEKRIAKLPKKNNWWGPAGETGPCGPDTEMFYWVGDPAETPEAFNDDHPNWVEIWNDVFMQYNKQSDGSFKPLQQKNVDTGMGLVRVLAVANGLADNYQTELFLPIINQLEAFSGQKYLDSAETKKAMRIIADHLKAATFIIGDELGVGPSNTDQGYVVRRLIRRAIRYGKQLGIQNDSWTKEIGRLVIGTYQAVYPELQKNRDRIASELESEEIKFNKTLEHGLREAEKLFNLYLKNQAIDTALKEPTPLDDLIVSGEDSFNLFQTYGFPIEMIEELAGEKGLIINKKTFNDELIKHQELSRTASAGMFKGGLADAGEISIKYHTATHLLLAALREILGPETYQKGSNITAERLRFDFNYPNKLTAEQLEQVENLVNQKIQAKIPVEMSELPKTEALKLAKVSFDPSKYGEIVKVYKIGDFSTELCGGPHVKNTQELGHFKIQKEEASSSGTRRIKAILD